MDKNQLYMGSKPKTDQHKIIFPLTPSLILIWLGFLGVCFGVGENYPPPPPCLKPVAIMLETWILGCNTYVVLEKIPFSSKAFLILLMSAFFWPNNTFTQNNSVRAVFDIF